MGAEHEYLDEQTAATVTVREPALVFARERPELAVNARDYLTLGAGGRQPGRKARQYYYGVVHHDKRRVSGRRPRTLGLGEAPVPPPARSAQVLVAPVSRDTQEFVARATELRAVVWMRA